jgi:hypothetical protein
MYKGRTLNPLGVRKLDVQEPRRVSRREHRIAAARLIEFGARLDHGKLSERDVLRLVTTALDIGWEEGVKIGSAAQLGRVREALENGTLIKPDSES